MGTIEVARYELQELLPLGFGEGLGEEVEVVQSHYALSPP